MILTCTLCSSSSLDFSLATDVSTCWLSLSSAFFFSSSNFSCSSLCKQVDRNKTIQEKVILCAIGTITVYRLFHPCKKRDNAYFSVELMLTLMKYDFLASHQCTIPFSVITKIYQDKFLLALHKSKQWNLLISK